MHRPSSNSVHIYYGRLVAREPGSKPERPPHLAMGGRRALYLLTLFHASCVFDRTGKMLFKFFSLAVPLQPLTSLVRCQSDEHVVRAFQAYDEGSIPFTRSMILNSKCSLG